jgi:WD repeat-containing protein 76
MLRVWSAEHVRTEGPDGGAGRTGGAWGATLAIKHDNNTGRWLLPFRAIWAADGSAVICGSMKRETEFFSASTGKSLKALKNPELLTAVPSRHAVNAEGTAIAAATASGRVHIWMSRA